MKQNYNFFFKKKNIFPVFSSTGKMIAILVIFKLEFLRAVDYPSSNAGSILL